LRQVSKVSGETTYVSILDGTYILYVNKVESSQSIRSNCTIGTRNPLYCSSMGKAILAHLEDDEVNGLLGKIDLIPRTANTIVERDALLEELKRIKARGYSIDDEEIEDNVRCVGAPIFNHRGYPFAAMSLSGPESRLPVAKLHELSQIILDATQNISRQLGYIK
jgi:DNA-binding IclR family transcriptional regulator